ncbi:hypothetical protein R3P38DRAFT_3408933 [Favolaschia claudopus]|uniref:Uncharacterized protein n=1 Tax=Favolaschia claudopus TaxID=2862362 RepID=A0AAV9ZU75_9AGAR
MLYQVMMENDCGYDGYLWAPFDTFLNVPRLQQFDKARFWYSSPWAQYVPNPALHIVNKSREHEHHPRLGWPACRPAFAKVPLPLRQNLAEYYNGEIRLHWLAWGPMNATWVREQWENALEVDTFHTFYWGSVHAETFKMREGIVEDTRFVLAQSAARQGIEWE